MLNLKKGLALVLAAATAFTFAPIANLGTPVQAEAAEDPIVISDVRNATFQNVADNIYLRDIVNTSVTIKPTYVVDNNDPARSYDGSKLYYQVTADEPNALTLAQTSYATETNVVTSGGSAAISATGGYLKVEEGQGSVKLTRSAELAGTTELWLAAYKPGTRSNEFNLVGYKKITIHKHVNAAYTLKLDQSTYTLALDVNEESDPLTKNMKVSDADGKYLNDSEMAQFTTSGASWTVSGDNVESMTRAYYDSNKASLKRDRNDLYAIYDTTNNQFIANAAGNTKVEVTLASADGQKIAQTNINLEVLGTSKYTLKATVDGSESAGEIGSATNPIVLNLKNLSTYNLSQHIYKNNASMVLSYESDNARNTVNETTGVVTATTPVDQFIVKVRGKINGRTIAILPVYFKVNSLPYDTLSVTGEDKDSATVLSKTDYEAVRNSVISDTDDTSNNKARNTLPTEKQLAGSQIKYVQIEVTGAEKSNVTESLSIVSTGGAIVKASLEDANPTDVVQDVTANGVITLKKGVTSGVAVIKLISSATAKNELTESYVFVVVDKADPTVNMAKPAYTVGTKQLAPTEATATINFKKEYNVKSVEFLAEQNDLLATQTLYRNGTENNKCFDKKSERDEYVSAANTSGKTMYVLLEYAPSGDTGSKFQIITITSVPGVTNTITKIEDATSNKVIYTPDMGTIVPEDVLERVTTFKVTIAYSIDKNETTANISSTSLYTNAGAKLDPLNQNIMTAHKETVKKGDTFNTFYLYPTANGTQVVTFAPSGRISETNRSIVDDNGQDLAVTFRSATKPEKVTGVKLGNKKGAKVVVKFAKVGTNNNMKYYVQKKIGKKTAGKSVASTRTILSVKKGATVKVRVKAYYYDSEGNKHVGAYSKWVTKKTDKK